MRYRGRVKISKVDRHGNKIKNLKVWKNANPGDIYFDSYPEWEVWDYMMISSINFVYEPKIDLFDSIDTEEFEKPRQTKKAKLSKDNKRVIKDVKQRPISYKPDYYLIDFDAYIEVKGFADDVFKLRWKLFKLKGYKGFIVYSLLEFKELYEQLNNNIND